jgi:hypothetical protein
MYGESTPRRASPRRKARCMEECEKLEKRNRSQQQALIKVEITTSKHLIEVYPSHSAIRTPYNW